MVRRHPVVRFARSSLSRTRRYFFLAAVIYLGAAIVGVEFVGTASTTASRTDVLESPGFTTILVSNLRVLGTLSFGGVLLAIPTLVNLLLNGVAFGMVVTSAARHADPVVVTSLFVPHGVFEIPGLWLGSAAGLLVPGRLVEYLRGSEPHLFETRDVYDFLTVVTLAAMLIVVGALVESTVTPWAYSVVS